VRTRSTRVGVALFLVLALGPAAYPLINPKFTPIDLVQQSELMLKIEFGPIKNNHCVCTVKKVLQGKMERKTIALDLSKAMNETEAKRMARHIAASGKEPGVLFVGRYVESDAEHEGESKGFLHVRGRWIDLRGGKGDLWELDKIDKDMERCWAGGTDMLLRAVDYILSDDGADVPCKVRASWSSISKVGTVRGKVTFSGPVDLDGNGKPYLFVTSSDGDRLFHYRGGALKDVTAEKTLRSKSRVSAWIDCSGDGKIDLVSWDGTSFSLHLQDRNGRIVQTRTLAAKAPRESCVGLSVLDVGRNGKPGLLVSTRGAPVLLLPGDLPRKPRKLAEVGLPAKGLGKAAACLVADFDGDSFPDIVQPFEKGSFFYGGKGSGRFAAPVRCGVALGKNGADACTGDFDADGLLDILTTGGDGCEIWQNIGKGKFVPRRRLSGEIAYISKPDGITCQACDINNDGRQDIFIAYKSMGAQIFFSRGFRSTGHAHGLDLADKGLLGPAEKGQQTGCIGDFNADGAQDMVLVLKQGDTYVFWRDTTEASPLAVKVDLSPKGACSGPLTVTGWLKKRCLGAWNVVPGTSAGFIGLLEAGPRTIKWQLPGGKPQRKKLVVEDQAVRFLIK